jgi:glycosyltransferase involved in cell wall biosynthesis
MRIGIHLPLKIDCGGGGAETYVRNLIKWLQLIDLRNEYSLICTPQNEEAFPINNINFQKKINSPIHIFLKGAVYSRMIPFRRFFLSKIYKWCGVGGGINLIHFPLQVFPHHVRFNIPVILTVLDIQQEYFPGYFNKETLESRKRYYRPSAEAATRIIAISEFTKKTLIEKYDIPEHKISVVHLGFDKEEFGKIDTTFLKAVKEKYDLPERFLFYPAATWPHKNHINLVRALKILKENGSFKDKLVLTGLAMEGHSNITDEIAKLGLSEDVKFIGYLPYNEIPAIFNLATLMVFPSLFEGFGIPVIEAMAVGLPVVCSNKASLPEVAGDAAVLFEPTEPEDIAEKIVRVSEDRQLREKLIAKGFERAEFFTWEKIARETLAIYEEVSKIKT